mgnify:CR=1 FL=1
MAVTSVPRVSQWALTTRMAWGLGSVDPMLRNPATNSFSSIAFIGLP